MALSLAAGVANAITDLITAKVDAGSGPGTIKVYSGSKPSTVATSPTGTLLGTFTLNDPSFGASSGGVAALATGSAISTTAAATGTAGWFRAADSTGAAVYDGTVGTSGADLNFSSVSWTSGDPVSITSGSLTEPLG